MYHLLAIVTVVIWGVTFVNTKVLLQHGMSPMEIFLVRFVAAYLCMWSFMLAERYSKKEKENKRPPFSWSDELTFLLLGFVGGSLYFLTENTALTLSYANNVAFIVCTAPLITMLMALILVKSVKATAPLVAGSLIALIGVGMVIYNGHFVLHLNPLGDFLALSAAICWAVYSLVIKRVSTRYTPAFVTRKVFFYGILTVLPLFVLAEFIDIPGVQPWRFPLEGFLQPAVWMNLLFLSVIASFACFLWWNIAVKHIGALRTANYVYLNPISTVVASALVLNESMTLMAVFGSGLILIGVYIANRHERF